MLDMFKRPGDPEEHNHLYAIPTGALLGLYTLGYSLGFEQVTSFTYLASAAASIAAIACLANQKTARTGNALGMMGVTGGVAATAGLLAPSAAVTGQLLGCLGTGLGTGYFLAKQMKITELPQMVAAFHSLVLLLIELTTGLRCKRGFERPLQARAAPLAVKSVFASSLCMALGCRLRSFDS